MGWEIDLVPIVQEVGRLPGLVWIGVENLAPTRILSPTDYTWLVHFTKSSSLGN